MLRVQLFGSFAMEQERPIDLAIGKTGRQLASYLFSFPNKPHRREKLLDLFWCESDADQARGALSTALWRIRRQMPDELKSVLELRANSREICLDLMDPDIVDVHRFHSTTKKAFCSNIHVTDFEALDRAASLHKAPFLEEYDEDWVLELRERLQSLYLRSLTHLMRWHAQEKRYEDALAYGQKILSSDPMRETVQRSVMLLYVLNGQRAEAIRQFRRCETALRSECDVDPMPETTDLFMLMKSDAIFQKLSQLVEKELIPSADGPVRVPPV